MLLITDLRDIPSFTETCGLSLGSFDGVHLGHQALLKHLKSALPSSPLVVFTFSTHPSHLFTPDRPTPFICPPLQKAKLLFEYGADVVILIPFTAEFASTPFSDFLGYLKKQLKFSHLALGVGATFGRNKEGDETAVRKLAEKLQFNVDYLPKTMLGDAPISSGKVRSLIGKAAFHEVQECLGRRYSLMGRCQNNEFYHLILEGICLPSEGIYPVRVKTPYGAHLARAYVMPQQQKISFDLFHEAASLHNEDIELVF